MKSPKIPLLIIDVQVSAAWAFPNLPKKIEELQKSYECVFVSVFHGKDSYLPKLIDWNGYENENLAFRPIEYAKIFTKNGYSSFIPELKQFHTVHICGFDTDACVYKTAMDLIEENIRPVVLASYCGSASKELHETALVLLQRNIGKGNIIR